ncbi:LuxR C-terminal-related transcriptional regulator [Streptomyces sp.]|uniref:helix-turn-helix transcriptional regulator n=1 Tax=Streptomyces sp. TaxID=1931 RepID=UPI0028121D86|nr:AAA family ATPase [Streptomyces sp.]
MRRENRLLERDCEFGFVQSALQHAMGGDGAVLAFEGTGGLGKTSLLQSLRVAAQTQGFRVLHARGSELERDFPWTVVRQLFERLLAADPAGTGDGAALTGRAALIRTLFDYDQEHHPGGLAALGEDELYATVHGLYWLCCNLSARQPLLLVVDDAQWADRFSLHFISYLINRLEGESVLVALAHSPAPSAHAAAQDLIMSARASPLATVARLAPLSEDAAREVLTAQLGTAPHDSVVHRCMEITEGNPLHLTELAKEMKSQGLRPTASAVPGIRLLSPASIAWDIRRSLGRLPEPAVALAQAIAVLDTDAAPQHSADVAGLDESGADEAAKYLRDSGVLRSGTPYAFHSSVARHVVYADMTAQQRHQAHRRAAASLHAADAGPATVAEHICRTGPGVPPWAVRVLRSASSQAVQTGQPATAVRYLRRALAEPTPDPSRAHLLAQLGSAELLARDRAAVSHLAEAVHHSRDREVIRAVRPELALALAASGRYPEAVDVARQSCGTASGPEDTVTTRARLIERVLTRMSRGGSRTTPAYDLTPGAVRAHAAVEAWSRGLPAGRVARFASAAVADGVRLPDQDMELPPVSLAAWMLTQCDDLPAAEQVLTRVARQASRHGLLLTATTAESMRARVLLDTGRLAEAETVARSVLGDHHTTALTPVGVPVAAAVLVHCLIETGRPAEAEELLKARGLTGTLPDAAPFVPLRLARGRLSIRLTRDEDGLQELLACRALALAEGWLYPSATTEYLTDAARALAVTGSVRAARALALEEVNRCRAFGAARPLAVALRTLASVTGDKVLARLEDADRLLEDLPDALERARTMVELGSALRRAGHRTQARQPLTAGLKLAHGIGAATVAAAARSELRLAGTRLSRVGDGLCTALTPAEERVAQKAAEGLSNKEISRELYVSVKTVEWHLGQVYAKLGIAKRSELPRALPLDGSPVRQSS